MKRKLILAAVTIALTAFPAHASASAPDDPKPQDPPLVPVVLPPLDSIGPAQSIVPGSNAGIQDPPYVAVILPGPDSIGAPQTTTPGINSGTQDPRPNDPPYVPPVPQSARPWANVEAAPPW